MLAQLWTNVTDVGPELSQLSTDAVASPIYPAIDMV